MFHTPTKDVLLKNPRFDVVPTVFGTKILNCDKPLVRPSPTCMDEPVPEKKKAKKCASTLRESSDCEVLGTFLQIQPRVRGHGLATDVLLMIYQGFGGMVWPLMCY